MIFERYVGTDRLACAFARGCEIFALNCHFESVIGFVTDLRVHRAYQSLPPDFDVHDLNTIRKACGSLAECCFNLAEKKVRCRQHPPEQANISCSIGQHGGLGRRRATVKFIYIALALILAGCDSNPLGSQAPAPAVERGTPRAADDYIIGSGDQLSIFVYRNPDLSEAGVAVRPDGRISTPLIEDIAAAGKTPTQLAREIEQRLTKFVQEPNVTVIVRSFIGPADRQVRVIGEASDPIAIPYRDHMTLLDVMIATRGLTKYAAGNRAVIVRTDPAGKHQTIKVHLNDLIKDGDISQNLEMSPGDTLIVPQTWF